jgi:tubulin---tyrosine ligase
MWVVKPAALNQGKGIEVMKNLRDITEFIFQKNQKDSFWVIQKYIEKPFLYRDRKFDIRIWALVTHDFQIYVYLDGYLRTSSSEYDLSNNDTFVHLTN